MTEICGSVDVGDNTTKCTGWIVYHKVYKEAQKVQAYSEPQCWLWSETGEWDLLEIPFRTDEAAVRWLVKHTSETCERDWVPFNRDNEHKVLVEINDNKVRVKVEDMDAGEILFDDLVTNCLSYKITDIYNPFLNHEPHLEDCSNMENGIEENLTQTEFAKLRNDYWHENQLSYDETEKGTLDIYLGYYNEEWYVYQN